MTEPDKQLIPPVSKADRAQIQDIFDAGIDDLFDRIDDLGLNPEHVREVLVGYDLEDEWRNYLRQNAEDQAAIDQYKTNPEPAHPFNP